MANGEAGKDPPSKKFNIRARTGHISKLSCSATGKHKRDKTGSQVHINVSDSVQPEKITDVGKP